MKSIVVSLVALVVFLLMAELGLRGIYVIRASMIERLTLPYDEFSFGPSSLLALTR